MSFSCSRFVTLAVAMSTGFLGIGCGDLTGSKRASDVIGAYRLESVNGASVPTTGLGAVLQGELSLEPNGTAARRVTHQLSGVAPEREFVARGTFAIEGDSLRLALVQDPARPELVWRPRASLTNGAVTLRYPRPGDGLEIVEVFRRMP